MGTMAMAAKNDAAYGDFMYFFEQGSQQAVGLSFVGGSSSGKEFGYQ